LGIIIKMNQVKAILLLGSALLASAKDDSVGCIASLNGYFFDLKPLSIAPNAAVPEESEAYNASFQTEDGDNSIQFNLCERTVRTCPDQMGDFANIINANNTCNHLS
jgi:hypothetical protein